MDPDPQPDRKSQRELAFSKIFLVVLAAIGMLFVVWAAWIRPGNEPTKIHSFEECVAAGNPVQESYPEVCVLPEGQRFVNPSQKVENPLY